MTVVCSVVGCGELEGVLPLLYSIRSATRISQISKKLTTTHHTPYYSCSTYSCITAIDQYSTYITAVSKYGGA